MVEKKRNMLSFTVTEKFANNLADHVDKMSITMRKKGVSFTKQQLCVYLLERGLKSIDKEDFIIYLQQGEKV